eukprot:gnl/TRDRNA2_/TRDRNA2_170828_c0_seq2.p1 gnl/TRDRNA2_/TRDRNA2_170828_c0~~gnl/TRDRNA2_/TRDRNA2_170828_c0_seq2.p1  ORF type:complete len:224 (-),score=27.09 gnl/TRDRNA2_/TRDRNA2_170828_c0_seq2:256-927(-)
MSRAKTRPRWYDLVDPDDDDHDQFQWGGLSYGDANLSDEESDRSGGSAGSSGEQEDGLETEERPRQISNSTVSHPGSSSDDSRMQLLECAMDSLSIGSNLHNTGECKRCRWVSSKRGCYAGKDCSFCHAPHARFARPGRKKRRSCKKAAEALDAAGEIALEDVARALAPDEGGYMHTIIQHKLKSRRGGNAEELPPQPTESFAPESRPSEDDACSRTYPAAFQ